MRALRSTNLMSNGRYSVMVTATGSGYSRWNDLAVTRWQPDPTEDRLGTYHLPARHRRRATGGRRPSEPQARRRRGSADACSATTRRASSRRSARCAARSSASSSPKAMARAGGSSSVNDGAVDRHIEVTSFAELVLAPEDCRQRPSGLLEDVRRDRDRATTATPSSRTRRKRDPNEPDMCVAAHFVTDPSGLARDTEAETDRRAFIGRGRTIADRGGLRSAARRLARQRRLHARSGRGAAAARARAGQQEGLADLLDGRRRRTARSSTDHRSPGSTIPKRFAAAGHAVPGPARRCRPAIIGLSLADAANVQKLAPLSDLSRSASCGCRRERDRLGARHAVGAVADWRFPATSRSSRCASATSPISRSSRQALRFQEYMRARGLIADLVIVNEQASSYVQDLQQAIESLCENSRLRGTELGPRQHIFAVRRDLMDETTYRTLLAVGPRRPAHAQRHHLRPDRARGGGGAAGARCRWQPAEAPATPRRLRAAAGSVAVAAPIAARRRRAGLLERLWRLRRRRPRLCGAPARRRARRRSRGSTSFPTQRFGFHSLGRGRGLHLEPQQPRLPADAVDERSGDQPAGRGASTSTIAPAARRSRPFAGRRARSAGAATRHGTARAFRPSASKRGPLSTRADPSGRSGAIRSRFRACGSSNSGARRRRRLRVYAYAEWVLGNNRAQDGADHRACRRTRQRARCLAAQSLQPRFRRARRLLGARRQGRSSVTADRHEFIGRAAPSSAARGAGRAPPCPAASRRVTIPARRWPAMSRCRPAAT